MRDDLMRQTNMVILVARTLIGKIEPIGETNEDERRLDNLRVAIAVADTLVSDIRTVAEYKGNPAYSLDKAGKMAHDFICTLEDGE